MSAFRFASLSCSCIALLAVGQAVAGEIGAGVSKTAPVLLTAREMGYDEKRAVAVAVGNVEIIQGQTVLLADRLDYDQNRDIVHASGHVSILQASGDVVFSDDAWLTQGMEKGVVQQFRARLKDNSLFAAREGHKTSKNVTHLSDAVYSPCHICAPATPGAPAPAPLWQMRAKDVTIDENKQRVYYHDALMDLYGLPVFYTPYFSHPTPDAPSQSGLLTPQYFHASDLGNVVKEPLFLSLAPNMDMTLTPWYLSQAKPVLEADFRHLLENGSYELRGAITDTYNYDAAGNKTPGTSMRGFVEAHGKFTWADAADAAAPRWNVGFDGERTTDDTFLQLYRFGWQDMLTSRLYAERLKGRNYFVIESLAFQGLEAQDIGSQSPYILPQVNWHVESDPLALHSRLALDSNALVLQRSEGDTDQRLSSTASWKLPYITRGGQVLEAKASLRGDGYNVNNQPLGGSVTPNSTSRQATFDGQEGRVIPQASVEWRYPLLKRFDNGESVTLSPLAMAAVSPERHDPAAIPNEDSRIAELSDVNIFSPDRYTGLDRVESGLRAAYGVRGQWQRATDQYVEWLLGQAYTQSDQDAFPLAINPMSHFSDYIGRLALKYKWTEIAYSFRLDRDTVSPITNQVNMNFALSPVHFDVTYVSLRDEQLFGDRREIFGNTAFDLTPHWQWTVSGRRDLGSTTQTPLNPAYPVSYINPLEASSGTVGFNSAIVFHNECLSLTTGIGRNYINQQDVRPSTTFSVILILKNFGAPEPHAASQPTTGAGNVGPATVEPASVTPLPMPPAPASATVPVAASSSSKETPL